MDVVTGADDGAEDGVVVGEEGDGVSGIIHCKALVSVVDFVVDGGVDVENNSVDEEGGEAMIDIAKRRTAAMAVVDATVACLMVDWSVVVVVVALFEIGCKFLSLFR